MENKFKSEKRYVQDDKASVLNQSEAYEIPETVNFSNESEILTAEDHMLSQYVNNLNESQRKRAFQHTKMFSVNLETEGELKKNAQIEVTFKPENTQNSVYMIPTLEDD